MESQEQTIITLPFSKTRFPLTRKQFDYIESFPNLNRICSKYAMFNYCTGKLASEIISALKTGNTVTINQ